MELADVSLNTVSRLATHKNVHRNLRNDFCLLHILTSLDSWGLYMCHFLASITCFVAMVTVKIYEGYHAHCQHCPVALFIEEKWRKIVASVSLHDDLNT